MDMSYIRAEIQFVTQTDVVKFISILNESDTDNYVVENDDHLCVNARSVLGMLYACSEMGKHMYLVNKTNDGHFPSGIDNYRV